MAPCVTLSALLLPLTITLLAVAVQATPIAATPTPIVSNCAGDCDSSGEVSIGELIRAVSIALGRLPLAACAAADANRNGHVGIPDLIRAVGRALDGCTGANPEFAAPRIFPAGSQHRGLVVADFNGDQHPDLLSASTDGTLSVLLSSH